MLGLTATRVRVSAPTVSVSSHSLATMPGCFGLVPLMTVRMKVDASSQPVEYSRKNGGASGRHACPSWKKSKSRCSCACQAEVHGVLPS